MYLGFTKKNLIAIFLLLACIFISLALSNIPFLVSDHKASIHMEGMEDGEEGEDATETTTPPPVVATQPPVVITQPPVVTTSPPVVTTRPPVVNPKPNGVTGAVDKPINFKKCKNPKLNPKQLTKIPNEMMKYTKCISNKLAEFERAINKHQHNIL